MSFDILPQMGYSIVPHWDLGASGVPHSSFCSVFCYNKFDFDLFICSPTLLFTFIHSSFDTFTFLPRWWVIHSFHRFHSQWPFDHSTFYSSILSFNLFLGPTFILTTFTIHSRFVVHSTTLPHLLILPLFWPFCCCCSVVEPICFDHPTTTFPVLCSFVVTLLFSGTCVSFVGILIICRSLSVHVHSIRCWFVRCWNLSRFQVEFCSKFDSHSVHSHSCSVHSVHWWLPVLFCHFRFSPLNFVCHSCSDWAVPPWNWWALGRWAGNNGVVRLGTFVCWMKYYLVVLVPLNFLCHLGTADAQACISFAVAWVPGGPGGVVSTGFCQDRHQFRPHCRVSASAVLPLWYRPGCRFTISLF